MSSVNEGSVLAIGIIFISLGTIAVAARFFVRAKGTAALGIDDWLSLPALILVIAESVIMIIGSATHTIGNHSPPGLGPKLVFDTDPRQLLLERLEFAFDIIQVPALALIKLTILFFYRRIFLGRAFNIASWVLIGAAVAWGLTFFIVQFAACGTSLGAEWSSLASLKGKCVNTFDIFITLSAFDVAVDLGILIMPIPFVLKLQMPLRRKLAVLSILLLGTLAIACGLTRMVFFIEILGHSCKRCEQYDGLETCSDITMVLSESKVAGVPSDDDIGVVSILLFWAMMEMGVAMIAVCLPTLRPLFRNWSLESIIRSVRSAVSLRSMGSSHAPPPTAQEAAARSESETAIARPQQPRLGYKHYDEMDVEAYSLDEMGG